MNIPSTVVDGIEIFNMTPHFIRFINGRGDMIQVEKSGVTIGGQPQEVTITKQYGIEFISTKFVPTEHGKNVINIIKSQPLADGAKTRIIVGSIIDAQTYSGVVASLVPTAGTERAAPDDKRFRLDKFNIF